MILRGPDGRLRWGWRLLFFFLLFALLLLVTNQLLFWLGAPWFTGAWPERWGIVGPALAAVGASWLMMEKVERTPLAGLGLPLDRETGRSLAAGFALGLVLMGVVLLALVLLGQLRWFHEPTARGAWGSLLEFSLFLLVAAFAEELLLRGYLFQVLAEGAGWTGAIALTALIFGALHAVNPNVSALALLNITLAGVLLGVAFQRTLSLWFVTGLHFAWNWVMGVPADLPVSGLDDGTPGFGFDMPGYGAVLGDTVLVTGGAFGPEGGILVTIVSVLVTLWLWRTKRLTQRLAVLALRPPATRRGLASGPEHVTMSTSET